MKILFPFKMLLFILILSLVYSCKPANEKMFFIGEFPDVPVNLIEFNTEYDDYNSAAPSYGESFPFCFSSNRNSSGDNYDIVYKLMTIDFSKTSGVLKVHRTTKGNLDVVIENGSINSALTKINTEYDEFGPYLISQGRVNGVSNINKRYESYVFLYSTGTDGNQDVLFTNNVDNELYETPEKVNFINSEFNDAYPSFNQDNSKLFFTSDREGVYNIYSSQTDNTKSILEILKKTKTIPQKETILSSAFDDKCPFIYGNTMVFTSNRDGGYGGYDLYYSILKNNKWSQPINFGDKINTSNDEFRPIVRKQGDFINDFMLFSSNRPEGKGGFDLYYVGINKND